MHDKVIFKAVYFICRNKSTNSVDGNQHFLNLDLINSNVDFKKHLTQSKLVINWFELVFLAIYCKSHEFWILLHDNNSHLFCIKWLYIFLYWSVYFKHAFVDHHLGLKACKYIGLMCMQKCQFLLKQTSPNLHVFVWYLSSVGIYVLKLEGFRYWISRSWPGAIVNLVHIRQLQISLLMMLGIDRICSL